MKVLLIEDEIRIAQNIKKGLMSEHYIVELAHDGVEGYELAKEGNYDCILLDVMLPRKNGIEVCKDLRKNNNKTPILMLTAKSQINDKVEGLNTGADDYLTKPFAFEELLARIKALTRRPKETLLTTLTVGNITLFINTYEVTVGDKPIRLSKKEIMLLEYLMRNKEHVVSKKQIIEHVWDYDSNILPNTVEATIKNIRNKLKNGGNHIVTMRGIGYSIKEVL